MRGVCKPLKAVGIHTVSLHSGASIDHQINGLVSLPIILFSKTINVTPYGGEFLSTCFPKMQDPCSGPLIVLVP